MPSPTGSQSHHPPAKRARPGHAGCQGPAARPAPGALPPHGGMQCPPHGSCPHSPAPGCPQAQPTLQGGTGSHEEGLGGPPEGAPTEAEGSPAPAHRRAHVRSFGSSGRSSPSDLCPLDSPALLCYTDAQEASEALDGQSQGRELSRRSSGCTRRLLPPAEPVLSQHGADLASTGPPCPDSLSPASRPQPGLPEPGVGGRQLLGSRPWQCHPALPAVPACPAPLRPLC